MLLRDDAQPVFGQTDVTIAHEKSWRAVKPHVRVRDGGSPCLPGAPAKTAEIPFQDELIVPIDVAQLVLAEELFQVQLPPLAVSLRLLTGPSPTMVVPSRDCVTRLL